MLVKKRTYIVVINIKLACKLHRINLKRMVFPYLFNNKCRFYQEVRKTGQNLAGNLGNIENPFRIISMNSIGSEGKATRASAEVQHIHLPA